MEILEWISNAFIGLPLIFIIIRLTDTNNYKVTKAGMAYGKPKTTKVPGKTYIVCAILIVRTTWGQSQLKNIIYNQHT